MKIAPTIDFTRTESEEVKNLKRLLNAMEELLKVQKAQNDYISLIARQVEKLGDEILEIANAVNRLEVKP